MPVPLTALFAAALHQTRAAEADPVGTERVLSLLTRAAGGDSVVFELDTDRLMVNDIPVGGEAPGALLVRTALIEHDTSRLQLPAGMSSQQWGDVAQLFASAPGLFPSAEHVREALVASVPGASLLPHGRPAMSDELRAALFDIPGSHTDGRGRTDPSLATSGAERAELSTRLDPLLSEGFRAVEEREWERVADVVLRLHDLDVAGDEAAHAIIAHERRRMTPAHVVELLVHMLPKPGTAAIIGRAVAALGAEGANALIDALSAATTRAERRTYIDALAVAPEGEAAILTGLNSHRNALTCDAAEAAGRRRLERAVPQLVTMLRNSDEEVRTAAWHALEQIGTKEAMQALSKGHR